MSWLVRKIARRLSNAAVQPFASDEPTLEVGSYLEPSYGHFFPHRIGIDIRKGPGVDIVASVYELPFEDDRFANVLCMSVLEHLEDPARAISEMRRVLRPGGRIIVSVPFLFPIHDAPGDYWRFTKFGIRHLFREGWRIEQLIAEANLQESFAVLVQRVGYQTKLRLNHVMKVPLFLLAKLLAVMPSMVRRTFGNIQKSVEEPDAFASSFFMVATKT
jgi:SAM-dependent methyltransferase